VLHESPFYFRHGFIGCKCALQRLYEKFLLRKNYSQLSFQEVGAKILPLANNDLKEFKQLHSTDVDGCGKIFASVNGKN
jgi:hypothetical protein